MSSHLTSDLSSCLNLSTLLCVFVCLPVCAVKVQRSPRPLPWETGGSAPVLPPYHYNTYHPDQSAARSHNRHTNNPRTSTSVSLCPPTEVTKLHSSYFLSLQLWATHSLLAPCRPIVSHPSTWAPCPGTCIPQVHGGHWWGGSRRKRNLRAHVSLTWEHHPALMFWQHVSYFCASCSFLSISVSCVQHCGSRRAGCSHWNHRGNVARQWHHGVWPAAAGRSLRHGNVVLAATHCIHRPRQSGWTVSSRSRWCILFYIISVLRQNSCYSPRSLLSCFLFLLLLQYKWSFM